MPSSEHLCWQQDLPYMSFMPLYSPCKTEKRVARNVTSLRAKLPPNGLPKHVCPGPLHPAFLILHLYQLWFNMQFKELIGDPTAVSKGSELIIPLFQNSWVVLVYLAAFVLLWFHLTHGFGVRYTLSVGATRCG